MCRKCRSARPLHLDVVGRLQAFASRRQTTAADRGKLSRMTGPRAADSENVPHFWQIIADVPHHRHVIEATPQCGYDGDLSVAEPHHEAQLALTKNGH